MLGVNRLMTFGVARNEERMGKDGRNRKNRENERDGKRGEGVEGGNRKRGDCVGGGRK